VRQRREIVSFALAKSWACSYSCRTLQGNGYGTGDLRKRHLTPDHLQGAAGPFDNPLTPRPRSLTLSAKRAVRTEPSAHPRGHGVRAWRSILRRRLSGGRCRGRDSSPLTAL
jgi:hypothetical protein